MVHSLVDTMIAAHSEDLRSARLIDRVLFFLRMRRAVRIRGSSMEPSLSDGDLVMIRRSRHYGVGDIVVARHPFRASVHMVKRVASIAEGRYLLVGDNPAESTDSRTFGAVSINSIEAKAVCRLRRSKL